VIGSAELDPPRGKGITQLDLPPDWLSSDSARVTDRLLKLGRFSLVGLTCLGLATGVLAGLHDLAGVNYLVAYIASFAAGNVTGYLLNARFTFSANRVHYGGALRYMAINAALLGANTAALRYLVESLHLWYIAAAVALAIANTPISFIGQGLFTYRPHLRHGAPEL
jgi:putative flippase GtrA